MRLTALTSRAFSREAGAAGRDTRGNDPPASVHPKVELVSIAHSGNQHGPSTSRMLSCPGGGCSGGFGPCTKPRE